MKISSISLNNVYLKPGNSNVSFRNNSVTAVNATNPDVPQFKQAVSVNNARPSKSNGLFAALKSFIDSKPTDTTVLDGQALADYIEDRVYML